MFSTSKTTSIPLEINKFDQKWPNLAQNHQIQPKITIFDQKLPNSTKNHQIDRIENYIEKWQLSNNEEVGIKLHWIWNILMFQNNL